MKKLLLAIAVVTLMAGCNKAPEASNRAGTDFVVDKLFTHEGCTVYRFNDGGSSRYFTNCNGSTSWNRSCGKNCTARETID